MFTSSPSSIKVINVNKVFRLPMEKCTVDWECSKRKPTKNQTESPLLTDSILSSLDSDPRAVVVSPCLPLNN